MFPDKCSITEHGKPCVNPPEFIVSVTVKDDEYMVGVTCQKHRQIVSGKIQILQEEGIPLVLTSQKEQRSCTKIRLFQKIYI